MASYNNAYLKSGIELSVLQLLKAAAEVASLQVLQQEPFKLERFEKLAPTKEVAV